MVDDGVLGVNGGRNTASRLVVKILTPLPNDTFAATSSFGRNRPAISRLGAVKNLAAPRELHIPERDPEKRSSHSRELRLPFFRFPPSFHLLSLLATLHTPASLSSFFSRRTGVVHGGRKEGGGRRYVCRRVDRIHETRLPTRPPTPGDFSL